MMFGGSAKLTVPYSIPLMSITTLIASISDYWMMDQSSSPQNGPRIAEGIADGEVHMICDGTYQP